MGKIHTGICGVSVNMKRSSIFSILLAGLVWFAVYGAVAIFCPVPFFLGTFSFGL